MFLYIDSLFGDSREREVEPLGAVPLTLNQLYVRAMREHARDAVLLHQTDGRWARTPDWRLDRSVIRAALYLKENLNIQPGDPVALIGDLRPEWLYIDFAALVVGAISTAIPNDIPSEKIVEALVETGPRLVVAPQSVFESLGVEPTQLPGIESAMTLDGPGGEGAMALKGALELGGTLDTPERAQRIRSAAREATPDQPAVRHYSFADGALGWTDLTQGDLVERLKIHLVDQPAHRGDVVYLEGATVTLDLRLWLYAFVGDGYSSVALGQPDRAAPQVADLRPHKIVVSPKALEALLEPSQDPLKNGRAARGLRRLGARLTREGRARLAREQTREALGGRVRWIGPTSQLDAALSAQLSGAVAIGTRGAPEQSATEAMGGHGA